MVAVHVGDICRDLDTHLPRDPAVDADHRAFGRSRVADHVGARDHLPGPSRTGFYLRCTAEPVVIAASLRRHFSWDGLLRPRARAASKVQRRSPRKAATPASSLAGRSSSRWLPAGSSTSSPPMQARSAGAQATWLPSLPIPIPITLLATRCGGPAGGSLSSLSSTAGSRWVSPARTLPPV